MNGTRLDSAVIGSAATFIVKLPISAVFEPEKDITAYELAQMMPIFHGKQYYEEEWNALPSESWVRHWRRTDK